MFNNLMPHVKELGSDFFFFCVQYHIYCLTIVKAKFAQAKTVVMI